jgi:hypothetical protein
VTEQPITDDEWVLLEHLWAVGRPGDFPTDIAHLAQLARRAVGVARYGSLAVSSEVRQPSRSWSAGPFRSPGTSAGSITSRFGTPSRHARSLSASRRRRPPLPAAAPPGTQPARCGSRSRRAGSAR